MIIKWIFAGDKKKTYKMFKRHAMAKSNNIHVTVEIQNKTKKLCKMLTMTNATILIKNDSDENENNDFMMNRECFVIIIFII